MHCAVFEQLSLGQRLLFFAGHFPPLTMFWESIKVTKNQRMKALPPINNIPLGAKTLFPFFFFIWGGGGAFSFPPPPHYKLFNSQKLIHNSPH